ncbi:MAG TPA: helix-turn-helix transcriptional regulator [Streptosporangiaceae bacterium]|jgi:PadR family transcriptional regulator, regulatory protein PadR|nr:helix-turn-helix transcriptional regulator [Streptosporangiaceae bacterium]
MRAEALKGHLDGMLLRTGSGGRFDLPTGTIYPALHRLERAGLVQTSWAEAGGRRRRMYELTPAGLRSLDTERSTWREFSAAVTALLKPQLGRAAT